MPLTEHEKDQIARQAIEHAEFTRSIQESLRPANLTVAGLRSRIGHARVEAERHTTSRDYYQGKLDQWTDELKELEAELRKRPDR